MESEFGSLEALVDSIWRKRYIVVNVLIVGVLAKKFQLGWLIIRQSFRWREKEPVKET